MLILTSRRGTLTALHVIQVSLTRVVVEALPSLLIGGWPRVYTHTHPQEYTLALTAGCTSGPSTAAALHLPDWLTWFSSAVLQGTKHTEEVAQCADTYWFTSLCTSTSRAHCEVLILYSHTPGVCVWFHKLAERFTKTLRCQVEILRKM